MKGVLCDFKHWYVVLKVLTFVSVFKSALCCENSFDPVVKKHPCFIIDLCLLSHSVLYSFIVGWLLLWEMFVVLLENIKLWLV
jgi:hypothetical protein